MYILGDTPGIVRVQGIYNPAECQALSYQILALGALALALCAIPGGQVACLGAGLNVAALQAIFIAVCTGR